MKSNVEVIVKCCCGSSFQLIRGGNFAPSYKQLDEWKEEHMQCSKVFMSFECSCGAKASFIKDDKGLCYQFLLFLLADVWTAQHKECCNEESEAKTRKNKSSTTKETA